MQYPEQQSLFTVQTWSNVVQVTLCPGGGLGGKGGGAREGGEGGGGVGGGGKRALSFKTHAGLPEESLPHLEEQHSDEFSQKSPMFLQL
jgi:hypothetical protein